MEKLYHNSIRHSKEDQINTKAILVIVGILILMILGIVLAFMNM